MDVWQEKDIAARTSPSSSTIAHAPGNIASIQCMEQSSDSLRPESVWDYPRPPRLEPCKSRIRVIFSGETVADSTRALRLLETSHPPSYYIPPGDVRQELLTSAHGSSYCEFKGRAQYWSLRQINSTGRPVAWSYASPRPAYRELRDHFCFYAGRELECFVERVRVIPQEGNFYGGWITPNLVGPFKGGPGTGGW